MARKAKTVTNVSVADLPVYDLDFPDTARAGRSLTPSVLEDRVRESYEQSQSKAVQYDGSQKQTKDEIKADGANQYTQIARELERAKRHLGLGLRGPVSVEQDGLWFVVFQAQDRRPYGDKNKSNGSAE